MRAIDSSQRRAAAIFYSEFVRAHNLERPAAVDGFEVGDRVLVVHDEECPEYVGRTGTIVDLRPWRVHRIGDVNPRTVVVGFDVNGCTDGFEADQLAPCPNNMADAA